MDNLTVAEIHNNIATAQAELAKLEKSGPDFSGLPKSPDYFGNMTAERQEAVRLARCANGELEQPIRDKHNERIRHLRGAIYAMQTEVERRGGRAISGVSQYVKDTYPPPAA